MPGQAGHGSRWARAAVAGAWAAVLAGCGGGGGVTTVGGTVSGLPAGTAVTLQLNGDESLVLGADGGFRFDTELDAGSRYEVTITSQPARAGCTVTRGSGEIDRNASRVSDVEVVCRQRRSVGGIVNGLPSGASVTLRNNATDTLQVSASGVFTFPGLLAEGASYEVTVSSTTGASCAVTQNATGTIGSGDITGVVVSCGQ